MACVCRERHGLGGVASSQESLGSMAGYILRHLLTLVAVTIATVIGLPFGLYAGSPINPPSGCHFHPRCSFASDRCGFETPEIRTGGLRHQVACRRSEEVASADRLAPPSVGVAGSRAGRSQDGIISTEQDLDYK
jgi:hypothetical protein